MKFKVLLATTLAIAVSAPAWATDDAAQQQAAPKEKKVCRTETLTGSLIAKRRICKTQAEWDELAAATKRDLDRFGQRQGVGSETGSANGANNTAGLGGF